MIQLKSEREIRLMRRSGLVVWKAHQIAREMIAPGVTTREIDGAIADYFRSRNGEPLFLNYPNSEEGKPPFPAVTCMSKNEAVVHGLPDDEPLREGDVLSLDTGVRIGGWCGDAAYTYKVGEVSAEVQKLLDCTEAVLELAFDLLNVKSRWSQVASTMERYVKDHGYTSVENFVGHGIGREMHEDPQVPNFVSRALRGRGDFRIEPGLVIAVEPMVNMGTKKVKLLKDHWTQVTEDCKPSAHFEHTIAITKDGPKKLTEAPGEDEMELLED